jgi:hypothetical protein
MPSTSSEDIEEPIPTYIIDLSLPPSQRYIRFATELAPRMLHFVRSESDTPEKIIATTITYAGFVGVLTGVRYIPFHKTVSRLG